MTLSGWFSSSSWICSAHVAAGPFRGQSPRENSSAGLQFPRLGAISVRPAGIQLQGLSRKQDGLMASEGFPPLVTSWREATQLLQGPEKAKRTCVFAGTKPAPSGELQWAGISSKETWKTCWWEEGTGTQVPGSGKIPAHLPQQCSEDSFGWMVTQGLALSSC